MDNENYENDENFDDDVEIPTADCWFIRQSKQDQQSSIVIIAYDQYNAVSQQVYFFTQITINDIL